MDLESNEAIRAELRRLSPEGDLVAVADSMRRSGCDSLLICGPGGRIAKVLSEHRVRRLAQPEPEMRPVESLIPVQAGPVPSSEGEGIRAQTR